MRAKIVAIHERDAFRNNVQLIGATGETLNFGPTGDPELAAEGWMSGTFSLDAPEFVDYGKPYFYAVKVEEVTDENPQS